MKVSDLIIERIKEAKNALNTSTTSEITVPRIRYFHIIFLIIFTISLRPVLGESLQILTEDDGVGSTMKNGKLTGYQVELIRKILKRLNQPDNIQLLPWPRAYRIVKSQKNTALFSVARTRKRDGLFQWVGPLSINTTALYKRKGSSLRIKTLEDAKKVRSIGTYNQDYREKLLKRLGFNNLDRSYTNVANIKKLINKRVDLSVISNVGFSLISSYTNYKPSDVEIAFILQKVYLYIAFSKSTSPTIVKKWQAALDQLKKDGTYEKIYNSYNIPDVMIYKKPTTEEIFQQDL